MTNDELMAIIKNPPDCDISMSITGDGAILKCGDRTHDLTDRQSEILYDRGGLILMHRIQLGRLQEYQVDKPTTTRI